MRFALAIGLLLFVPHSVQAEDFRVDSQVFVGKETKPQSTNVTMFHGPHAYDFLNQPPQITFYDLPRGRIVLVDPDRRVKAEVSRATLDAFCNNLKHLEKRTEDPVLDFALRPAFEQENDKDTSECVFKSKYVTYRVKAIAGELEGMAGKYRAFSDASARLNALVNRGSLPPFPRLLINESLDEAGQVPSQVHLTVSSARLVGGHTVHLRSEHEFRPRLLDSDLRQIDAAGELLGSAKPVSLGEYLRPSSDGD